MHDVFLSSTSRDLPDERTAVLRACRELGLGVVAMEDFPATGTGATAASLAQLDKARVYVGVFAYRYGYVEPAFDRSVTECEFDHAKRRGLDCLCFLVDDKVAWPDDRKEPDQLHRVAALKERVRSERVVRWFVNPHDLQHQVYRALEDWLGRHGGAARGPRRLPLPPLDFVGRGDVLDELERHGGGGVAISGLHGQGGVGKTALALKLAERFLSRCPDGHLYLDLRGVEAQPLAVRDARAEIIREFVGREARLPDDDLRRTYDDVLAGKRVLLLLDNAAGPEQVEGLLPRQGSAAVVLVTSRRKFTVPGLTAHDLAALPLGDAVTLLRGIASRLTDGEARTVAEDCGRLPLALRLAGQTLHRRPDLSAAEYRARLRERGRLKELDRVATVIAESEAQLPAEVRSRWRQLAVLAGGFEKPWAAAVWDVALADADDGLAALLEWNLLEWDAEERLYRLHDLVREYAVSNLDAATGEAAARRHAEYFCRAISAAHDAFLRGGAASTEGLARFDRLWTEAQRGFAWFAARRQGEADLARLCVQSAGASVYVRGLRQHPREQIGWLEVVATAAREIGHRGGEATALSGLGLAYADLGQVDKAIGYHEQCLVIAREIADRCSEGRTLSNLGLAYADLGQMDKAIRYYEQHLAIAREIGDLRGEARALGNLGVGYAALGQLGKAIGYHEQGLTIDRELGDRRGEGADLGTLGNAHYRLGQVEKAIACYEQSLAIAREIGDRRAEAYVCWNWGIALVKLGRVADAIPLMATCVAFERAIGHPAADKHAARVEELRRRLAQTPDR